LAAGYVTAHIDRNFVFVLWIDDELTVLHYNQPNTRSERKPKLTGLASGLAVGFNDYAFSLTQQRIALAATVTSF
jgi:hypothetical protein